MSYKRFIFCATIVAFLFISSAHCEGLTVSVSEGGSAGSVVSTSTFGAAANNAVEQALTLNPKEGTGKNALYAEGDYSTSRSVYGNRGGSCYSGFSVYGDYAKSSYDFSGDGNYYASLSEWLSASNADSIYAYGTAYSDEGYASGSLSAYSDYARAQASYYNYALASSSIAYDHQSVGSAIGDYVSASTYASNYDWGDYASSNYYASSDSVYYPAMIWNMEQNSFSDYYSATAGVSQGNSFAHSGYVGQSTYADNWYGDYAGAYQYSYYGMATSSYNYGYASGYYDDTYTYGSSYVYGYPTYMGAYAYDAYYGYASDYDYTYGWNTVYGYGYNYGYPYAYVGYY